MPCVLVQLNVLSGLNAHLHKSISNVQSYAEVGRRERVVVVVVVVVIKIGSASVGLRLHGFSRNSMSSSAMSELNESPRIPSKLTLNALAE
jgi:hypothetical protein